MTNNKKSVLIFGGSDFQLSLIEESLKMNLFTVVIDPNVQAIARNVADAFEVVDGQDFDGTCAVVEKYNIDAILTIATDRPLVMMSRIAKKYGFRFFSEETARNSTDKFLMKQKFIEFGFPHAYGKTIEKAPDDMQYPIIIKPTDSAGSRGVILCETREQADRFISESKQYTRKNYLLAEEFIDGKEYSIESIHYNGKSKIIQITEKFHSPLPYFVETGHIEPAVIDPVIYNKLETMISDVAKAFGFDNCGSHNELKIKDGKITIVEISPRIGGDFIAVLIRESTGINIEKALLQIALGEEPNLLATKQAAAGIFFFNFEQGKLSKVPDFDKIKNINGTVSYDFRLKVGDTIPIIKTGYDRYGYFIIAAENREQLLKLKENILNKI